MISKYTYKKLTWVDLESPTNEEILSLIEQYNLPLLVGEEIAGTTLRSKVDVYPNALYLVLHFPSLSHTNSEPCEQEVDFIIGKDFLITIHYELIDPLHEFSKVFEANSILDKSMMGDHAGFLFFYIIRELYKHLAHELDSMNGSLKEIKKLIFDGNEEQMVQEISKINHRLLDFKQAIRFHNETLKSFETAGRHFFGDGFGYYLSAITGEYNKVSNMLEGHREILADLRDTNDSILRSKVDDTMKKLTVMSFIIMPLTLIADVFCMNTFFPILRTTKDFYTVIGAMVAMALIMYVYFKRKKWF